ncbi:MAG TPA: PqqD family protein [Kiritimatiellia bacterium]|nr:PqqD family protein [Kiritimatiellia bacterium]
MKSERTTTSELPALWQDLLSAVLLRNQAAEVLDEAPDGSVMLAVPTRKPGFLIPPFSWIIRPPRERLTHLDPIGASLWRACDGRATVESLVEKFAIQHSLTFHESRVSVTSYVTSLLRRGVLAVAVGTGQP